MIASLTGLINGMKLCLMSIVAGRAPPRPLPPVPLPQVLAVEKEVANYTAVVIDRLITFFDLLYSTLTFSLMFSRLQPWSINDVFCCSLFMVCYIAF